MITIRNGWTSVLSCYNEMSTQAYVGSILEGGRCQSIGCVVVFIIWYGTALLNSTGSQLLQAWVPQQGVGHQPAVASTTRLEGRRVCIGNIKDVQLQTVVM